MTSTSRQPIPEIRRYPSGGILRGPASGLSFCRTPKAPVFLSFPSIPFPRVTPPLRGVRGAHETPHKSAPRSDWWGLPRTSPDPLRLGAALQGAKCKAPQDKRLHIWIHTRIPTRSPVFSGRKKKTPEPFHQFRRKVHGRGGRI